MTKQKQVVRHFCKCIKNNRYLIYISIQTLCYEPRSWVQVHLVSFDHLWDVSTTWLESTCGKLKWLDMIWKGLHLSIWGHTVNSACQSKNQAMRSKELSETGLCRGTDLGKGTKKCLQHWRSPRTQWPPSFLNGRSLEPPRLPRAGRPAKLSDRGRRAKNPMVPLSSKVPLRRWLSF